MNDINTRLVIDPSTKTISPKYRNQKAVYIAKHDHNSVRVYFEIPRYVDGYDMAKEDTVKQIHYVNIDGKDNTKYSKGFSDAIDIEIETDEVTGKEIVSFCWLVPKTATKYAGIVSVGVTFEEYETVNGKAQEKYSWSTLPYGKTIVWDSLDNDIEAVEREYSYLVATCNAIVSEALKSPLEHINEVYEKAKESVEVGKKATETGEQSAKISKSYAVGDTGTREGENEDNAKYYYEQTKISAENAKTSEDKASEHKNSAKFSEDNAKASEEKVEERYAELMKKPFASSLITEKAGESEVMINDVSPIEHDMFVKVTSNNIPLYPYDTNTDRIAGCKYTITDDGVFEIEGVSNVTEPGAAFIRTITLPAGEYILQFKGLTEHPYVCFFYGEEEDYVSGEYVHKMINVFRDETPFPFTLEEDTTVSLIFTWMGLMEGNEIPLDLSIKPYLSKGAEIAPEVSNAEIIVSDKDNNKTTYYADANGYVAVKSIHPTTIVRANEGLKLEVEYNKDLDSILRGHKEQIDELSKTAQENQASTEQHFKVLLENVGNIGDRANKNEESIEKLQKKINQNTEAVEKLDAGYSGMQKDIGSNAEKINSLNARQNVTDGELLNINGKINSLPSKVYVDNSVSEKERALREVINEKANSEDVNKALEEKANGVNGIAEKAIADADGNVIKNTYATKEEVGKTKGEIEILSEEVKSEIRAVGEQVKNSIPNDYSELSAKINNTSNALVGEASGTIVSMKDVSPVEHKMDVKVSSKNLIPFPYRDGMTKTHNGITYTVNEDESVTVTGTATAESYFILCSGIDFGDEPINAVGKEQATNGTYAVSKDLYYNTLKKIVSINVLSGATVNENFYPQVELGTTATPYTPYVADVSATTVKVLGKNMFDLSRATVGKDVSDIPYSHTTSSDFIPINPKETYTINHCKARAYYNANKERILVKTASFTRTRRITPTETPIDARYMRFDFYNSEPNEGWAWNDGTGVQMELGSVTTDYESYVVPTTYTPNADGTVEGVKSVYPTTILLTDTEGVTIEAEYNKDLNKAFEELYNAIISTGGNV